MINTILFDLDGTLLPLDTDEFIAAYFNAVSKELKNIFTAEEVKKYFWHATWATTNNTDPNKTNEEVFFEDFFKNTTISKKQLMELLGNFYKYDFKNIGENIQGNKQIIKSAKILKNKGYKLVLATNPLFPKSVLIDKIKWTGLDHRMFSFITSFEHMHYCKPKLEYYKEILQIIGKKSSDCLMVGNHIDEDMIAKEIGITTFLITNNYIGNLKDNKNIDQRGTYDDFLQFVEELPKIQ